MECSAVQSLIVLRITQLIATRGTEPLRRLLPAFSMRLQIFDLVSRISALRASKVGRGHRVAPHPAYEFKSGGRGHRIQKERL